MAAKSSKQASPRHWNFLSRCASCRVMVTVFLLLTMASVAVSQAFILGSNTGCVRESRELPFCRLSVSSSPKATPNAFANKCPFPMTGFGIQQAQKKHQGQVQMGLQFAQGQAAEKFEGMRYRFLGLKHRAHFGRDCSVSVGKMSQEKRSLKEIQNRIGKDYSLLDAVLTLAGETVSESALGEIKKLKEQWTREVKEAGGVKKFCLLNPQRFRVWTTNSGGTQKRVVTIIGGTTKTSETRLDAVLSHAAESESELASETFLDTVVSLAGETVEELVLAKMKNSKPEWRKVVKKAGGMRQFCLLYPHRFQVRTVKSKKGREKNLFTIKGVRDDEAQPVSMATSTLAQAEAPSRKKRLLLKRVQREDEDNRFEDTLEISSGSKLSEISDLSETESTAEQQTRTVHLIHTAARMAEAISNDPSLQPVGPQIQSVSERTVAIDAEGVPNELLLVQVATTKATYIFDCLSLGPDAVCSALEPMLSSSSIIKLFHDLRSDVLAFSRFGGIQHVSGTLDTQLVMEYLTGQLYTGYNGMLEHFGCQIHPTKRAVHKRLEVYGLQRAVAQTSAAPSQPSASPFSRRPLPADLLQYAADDVNLMLSAKNQIYATLGDDSDALSLLQQASDQKAFFALQSNGSRTMCFDTANSNALASNELLTAIRPLHVASFKPVSASADTDDLFSRLPEDIASTLGKYEGLTEVVLDIGRRPSVWSMGERSFPCENPRIVAQSDIDQVLSGMDTIGSDGRITLNEQLHRISAVRDRTGRPIGLTVRIGRSAIGIAGIIADLLEGGTKSVLLLGPPSSGKTTVLRDAARLLAETKNVWIVDASNEIAGDGVVPHPCVGMSRRMMVPSSNEQGRMMVEVIQNHAPDVIVVDEIGRADQVRAAETCRRRGINLVASAHGSLRDILKNTALAALLGGVSTVTVGDRRAQDSERESGQSQVNGKLEQVRTANPVFDAVVELDRSRPYEWRVIVDAQHAVDTLLRG
eukprot:2390697-Rhodomonas_salina.1